MPAAAQFLAVYALLELHRHSFGDARIGKVTLVGRYTTAEAGHGKACEK